MWKAKAQITLHICAVWSGPVLSTIRIIWVLWNVCIARSLIRWWNYACWSTVLWTSLGKRFLLGILNWKWTDHILSETICLFCFYVLFSNIYSKIKFTAQKWSDLWIFYSKVIFWIFCLRKYFLFFFADFELFHNDIVKISEKIERLELAENLPPHYLPYRFLHN